MGQAKHKNQFFKAAEGLFGKLSAAALQGELGLHDDAVLGLCELTGNRWFSLEDRDIQTLYDRALKGRSTALRQGLSLFLDSLLGHIWPSQDSANPELDLFLAVPCQVLPFLGDVIGDFDDMAPLQASLARELSVVHGLEGFELHLDCGLFDVDPFQGWAPVVQAAYVAKTPSLRESHGRRQCFRFSEEPAVAPVTRIVWARLAFQTTEHLGAAIQALSTPKPLDTSLGSLPYTVGSVTGQGSQQVLAGVRALAIGPAFSTLVQWAFQEGRLEIQAALRDVCQRNEVTPQQLKAMVVVVEQPSIALPEGVLGSEQTAAALGKSDPQVQVLFGRADAGVTDTVTLGRALFARANAKTMELVVQQAVELLCELGLHSVELGKLSSSPPPSKTET